MAGEGALPNLLVLGGMKCGTSSLHYYLGLHPEIQMSRTKELNFFFERSDLEMEGFVFEEGERRLVSRKGNWARGLDWYAAQFDAHSPVRGEASVSYTFPWFPPVPDRIAEAVPEARLIFVARHPLERMVSHYSQLGEHEWRPLDEALQPPSVYLTLSRYAALLAPYLERFPRERLLILRQEELLDRRHETMRSVFRFLGVDESFWSPAMSRVRNVSAAKGSRYWRWERIRRTRFAAPLRALPAGLRWRLERLAGSTSPQEAPPAVAPALRAAVAEALEPDLAELEGLTGWDLSAWRGDPQAARR